MRVRIRTALSIAGVLLFFAISALGQRHDDPKAPKMTTKHATGTFEVKVTPLPADDATGGPAIGRMAIDKQFSGDLAGSSKGQMLGYQASGSGGYVAMEQVTATLDGKKGTFLLQHIGTMEPGKSDINISVVPGSGTGDLTGISGKMKIIIEAGKHSYEFDYTLTPK
jgi:hypothetical protein